MSCPVRSNPIPTSRAIPIGFKVDEEKFFQVDPLKAPFVVEAFQRYNDGATMKELMNWLNDSGVTWSCKP